MTALTVSQVAAKIGVSAQTVRRLIRQGQLEAHNYGVRSTRIERAALDRYTATCKISALSSTGESGPSHGETTPASPASDQPALTPRRRTGLKPIAAPEALRSKLADIIAG